MHHSRILAAAAVAVAVLTLGSPAQADVTQSDRGAVGTVTLYGASPANPVWRTAYTTCTGQQADVAGSVERFANLPAPGCQVVLVKNGWTFELCVGRGLVPTAFQTSPIVRIEPGTSTACPVV